MLFAEWGDRSDTLFAESNVVLKIDHVSQNKRKIEVTYERSAAAAVFKDRASWLS